MGETSGGRGDGKVTQQAELVAAAHAPALDLGDNWFAGTADRLGEPDQQPGQPPPFARVECVLHGDITAGRERLVSGTGEHDHAYGGAGVRPIESTNQLVNGLFAKGVVHLGPVNRDRGDPSILAVVHIRCHRSACSCWRNRYFSTFPPTVAGSVSTKTIRFGVS